MDQSGLKQGSIEVIDILPPTPTSAMRGNDRLKSMGTKVPSGFTRGFSYISSMLQQDRKDQVEDKIDYETYKVNEIIAEHVENKELFV